MIKLLNSNIPAARKFVSSLFVLYGVWALADICTGLAAGQLRPNFGVFCLLIGPGLLCRNEIARVCAIAVTIVLMAYTLGAVASYVIHRPEWVGIPVLSRLVGQLYGPVRTLYVMLASSLFLALNVWQLWVLARPESRRDYGCGIDFR